MSQPAIAARLEQVREVSAQAALRAGRSPEEVTLVAVSKTFPVQAVREAMAAGQRIFGENRVQEVSEKYKELGGAVSWHFVGRLQRNKVRKLLGCVDLIHSVDRAELAAEIDHDAQAPVEVLIEVNISGRESSGGVAPAGLLGLLESVAPLERLRVQGLMGMAPVLGAAEEARPYFRSLAGMADQARREFPDMGLQHLSMGMSQDYWIAVEEGATLIRIGEAIFGRRPSRNGAQQGTHAGIEPATEVRGR